MTSIETVGTIVIKILKVVSEKSNRKNNVRHWRLVSDRSVECVDPEQF